LTLQEVALIELWLFIKPVYKKEEFEQANKDWPMTFINQSSGFSFYPLP